MVSHHAFGHFEDLGQCQEKPSALRIAACRSPSAFRMRPGDHPPLSGWPPVSRVGDRDRRGLVPSASVTVARRLRSADIWRPIASRISLGGVISRIPRVVIFTPQRVGHQIHLGLEDVVDLLPLRQHIVQRDVPTTAPEGGTRDSLRATYLTLKLAIASFSN